MAAHNNLGLARRTAMQGFAEALVSFDRALELDEGCTQAVQNLARVLDRLGHCDVAALVRSETAGQPGCHAHGSAVEHDAAPDSMPTQGRGHGTLLSKEICQGNLSMDRTELQVKAAADFLNAGDTGAAERIACELLARDPNNINALRLMGGVTRQQGDLQQSLKFFQRALSLNERKAVLHFELGTAYTELQQSEDAYRCYCKAVELDRLLQPSCQSRCRHHGAARCAMMRQSIGRLQAIPLKPDYGALVALQSIANVP